MNYYGRIVNGEKEIKNQNTRLISGNGKTVINPKQDDFIGCGYSLIAIPEKPDASKEYALDFVIENDTIIGQWTEMENVEIEEDNLVTMQPNSTVEV